MTEVTQAGPNFQRVAVSLQQRFAEKVANYEGEIAMLHDQYADKIEALEAEVERLKAEAENETVSKKK